jgi:2Fe-2S ferredoxin
MVITVHLVEASESGSAQTHTLQCQPGKSLMQAAVDANIPGIEADCGGLLTCGTCHVFVREPWASLLPPPDADELSMLDFTATPRRPHSRLSCQIRLALELDQLTVDLPHSQH